MIRWVIQDYFEAFRWQNIKETYKKGTWWWLIYLLGVVPVLMGAFDARESVFSYYCVMVPIFFCMGAEGIHSIILPKMMYLCPMSSDMRKRYIANATFVRIAIPIIVGWCGVVILLLSGICDWICGLGILLNISTFSICLGACICVNGPSKITENGTISPNAGLLEIFILIAGLLTGLLYASWLQGISDILWLKWGFVVAEVLVQIPMIVTYLKRWRESVGQALLYENSCAMNKENQRTGR